MSTRLPALDLAVVVGYLVGTVLPGAWFARRARSAEAFMSANRSVPGWVVGLSIFGSYVSSISFLANPGKSYAGDWNAFVFTLAAPPAAAIAAAWFVPFYRRLGGVSAYEHLERRFGTWARAYAVVCYLLTQTARTGTIVYLLALALAPLVGWDVRALIVLTAAVMTAYVTLGGMEAVIWTGALQGALLVAAPLACLWFLFAGVEGGVPRVVESAAAGGKFSLGEGGAGPSASTAWVVLAYGLAINLQNFAVDQGYVQRYVTARSDAEARRSVWVGAMLYVPVAALFFLIGTALWAFYAEHPRRLGGLDAAAAPDRVFPHFIAAELPPGLAGLVVAAVFAAAMDPSLGSMATLTLHDLYRRHLRPQAGEREGLRVLHVSTLVWGAASAGVALAMVRARNALDVWWELAGLFGGGVLGLFLLGRASPRVTGEHALAAAAAGLLVILWATFSPRLPRAFGGWVSPLHPSLTIVLGTVTILLVGLALAAVAPGRRS